MNVPDMSPCGMVVDWLRACYPSTRRLFRGRPEILTTGKYWLAPEGTPVLELPNLFGSSLWTRGEVSDVDLGELPNDGRYRFYNGVGPKPRPLPNRCGPEEHFYLGDPNEPQELPPDTVWGLLPCCESVPEIDEPASFAEFDLGNQPLLYMLAALVAAAYEPTAAIFDEILAAWLGPPVGRNFRPSDATLLPGWVIVEYPFYTLVVVPGTTNNGQTLAQVLEPVTAPANVGPFSTIRVWYNSALALAAAINAAGIDSSSPVLFVGHSYGGAVARVLQAIYHIAQPARSLQCVTFASPKPGDARLAAIEDRLHTLRIEGDADPVPGLPPGAFWTGLANVILGPLGALSFQTYAAGGDQLSLFDDGRLLQGAGEQVRFVDMQAVLLAIVAADPIPVGFSHLISTYCHRLLTGVPLGWDQFPVRNAALQVAALHYP